MLGYIKPKLYEYQMASYLRDQSYLKEGKKPRTRLELIRHLVDDSKQGASAEDQELNALLLAPQYENRHLEGHKHKKKRKKTRLRFSEDIGEDGVRSKNQITYILPQDDLLLSFFRSAMSGQGKD